MPSIGPTLPPHLSSKHKRKRSTDDDAPTSSSSSSSDQAGPRPQSPTDGDKRRKIMGPAMPPAPLDQRPSAPANAIDSDDSSSDDDYGPALPTEPACSGAAATGPSFPLEEEEEAPKPSKRDEWMLVPPKQDDLAARMDPTKLRARKFNSGKAARGGGAAPGGIESSWTETPEQKAKRLKDEVMGVSRPNTGAEAGRAASSKQDKETARRFREHVDKARGKSLFERNKETSKAEDDDPSTRKFDYSKDMAAGMKLGHAQKREMMNRAKDFGSKFSGGSYL